MKALIRLIKNKWFITLIGFIALVILIWFVGPQIAIAGKVPLLSATSRLILILVFVLIWALNLLRRQWLVNKANAQLTSSFGGTVPAEPSEDTERSREEVENLEVRFEEALQVLKKNSRSKGNPNIYELPWYIIIGPPGTGKTTALVNSGLHFPLAEKYGNEALRGVGGTRNCDWWFTDDAVLLDTAGRYTTQDSHSEVDKAAWDGFLQLLIRHRKRRPINGALVAISVSDLLTQSPGERDAQISAIKHRLQELNTQLKTSFPVYVFFTKCDLIPGFTEFFDDLGKEERGQVWGMTFPYKGAAEADVIGQFGGEFEALVDRLNVRVITRMEQERDIERRARIFSFPQQFDAVKPLMEEILGEIFKGSRYQSDTLLRGIYFTSGTQDGAPIDRVMSSLSSTLGVSSPMVGGGASQGRSYFVTRLFKDLIFSEAGLAGANQKAEIQRFWLQRASYGAAVLVTLIAVLAWTTSFTRNQVYVSRADTALEQYTEVRARSIPDTPSFTDILDPLTASRSVTEVYQPFWNDVPFLMGIGLYQGGRISQAADAAYAAELQRLLLPTIAKRLEQHLILGEKDADFLYQALKTYLMLGDPQRLDEAVVKKWMALDWGVTFRQEAQVQGQLQQHFDAMLAMGFEPPALNQSLIQRARANLKLESRAQLLYGMIKRDYIAADSKPLKLIDLYGPTGAQLFRYIGINADKARIPGLFTYEGYHEYFSKNLDGFVIRGDKEAWVLDDDTKPLSVPEKNQLRDDLRDLYFSDYRRSWEQMLGSIEVVPFHDVSQAAVVLNVASSAVSPIRRLLEVTARNTTLANASLLGKVGELGDKATDGAGSLDRFGRLFDAVSDETSIPQVKLPEQVIDEYFRPLNDMTRASEAGMVPLDPLLSMLSQLYGQLDALSAGFGQDAVSLVQGRGGSDVLRQLKVEATRQPEPLRGWLLAFVGNSQSATLGTAREEINRKWLAAVYPECRAALKGRYPFNNQADREVTLADFGRLFGPGGLLDTFYTSQLKPFTEVKAGRRQWKNTGGMGIGMSNKVLDLFQRAGVIKNMFFQEGGNKPSVVFKLKPVYLDANVGAINLDLEGQNFSYRHGPQFLKSARWPSHDSTSQVRLEFIDDSGNRLVRKFEGPWAWFRLLQASKVKSKTGDIALVTFEHRGRRSSWELHAQSVENPFLMSQLHQFYCPERL